MMILLERRNKSKYYHFYHNYGHNTEDYHDLKEQIENSFVKDTLRGLFGGTKNNGYWRDRSISSSVDLPREETTPRVVKPTLGLPLKNVRGSKMTPK